MPTNLEKIEQKIQDNPRTTAITLAILILTTTTLTALTLLPLNQINNTELLQKKNLSQDLVLHYDFESGNTQKIIDRSGNNNTGVINGDPEYVQTEEGTALKFDGDKDSVTLQEGRGPGPLNNSVTVYFEIKPEESRTLNFLGKQGSYYFWNRDGETYFTLFSQEEKFGQPSASIPESQWSEIIGTYGKGQEVKIYKDGKEEDSTESYNLSLDGGQDNFEVGMGSYADRWFNGSVEEVRVWNRTLTKREADALYNDREWVFENPKTIKRGFTIALVLFTLTISAIWRKK